MAINTEASTTRDIGSKGQAIGRTGLSKSAGELTEKVASSSDASRLEKASNSLRVRTVATISTKKDLEKFLLKYAQDGGLKDDGVQYIFKPEKNGRGPITEVCSMLSVISGKSPLIDIDTGKPTQAKFPITAFISDLFLAAGMEPPAHTRLQRLNVIDFEILNNGSKVAFGSSKALAPDEVAKRLDPAGYLLQEGRRERGLDETKELSPKEITVLAKARVKYFSQMVKDLREISEELSGLQDKEATTRAKHLKNFAQEILDQHFKGMKLSEVPSKNAGKALSDRANLESFKDEIKASQGVSTANCNVTPIKELMLGNDKAGRALAAKEFVYHLSNYYQMFPKGEVETINTYLKYMLHPEYKTMNWDIVTLSAKDSSRDNSTRAVAGIHYQAPDPFVILSELEKNNPGLLQKRLGVAPENLKSFLDNLNSAEQALVKSAWVEHFYRKPTEKPEVGKQLIAEALKIAKGSGNGVVSFEHEDVKKCSWELNLYSSGMVGLHPNERALAYAVSGGARIMVDPKTKQPLLNIQPELVKGGDQNFDLAWGFIFKTGDPPASLSIAAVKTFLLARYGTIDAIDPREDQTAGKPTAFAQMFDRLLELERAGIERIDFVPSRDVFFRDKAKQEKAA